MSTYKIQLPNLKAYFQNMYYFNSKTTYFGSGLRVTINGSMQLNGLFFKKCTTLFTKKLTILLLLLLGVMRCSISRHSLRLDFCSSCLYRQGAGITGICHIQYRQIQGFLPLGKHSCPPGAGGRVRGPGSHYIAQVNPRGPLPWFLGAMHVFTIFQDE